MDTGAMLRKILRWTGRIPTRYKLLYPFWLSAQLKQVDENRRFHGLPDDLDGLVIGYASDIHYGPLFDRKRAESLADALNAMDADILLLGGDYGEDTRTALKFLDILPPLWAKYGVYAALGNHDHMGSESEFGKLLDALNRAGYNPLMNAAHTIPIGSATLCICATDDIKRGVPRFEPILQEAAAADFTLYAPHSPDVLPVAIHQAGLRFDLALAGHTHGGQLVFFGRSLHSSSRYGDRYRTGWMQVDGREVIVSNGVGTSLLPMRIGAPAQIHRITLRKAT